MTSQSSGLPTGWDLARIRREAGDPGATLLEQGDRLIVLAARPLDPDYQELEAAVIISFTGTLVLLREPDDTGWHMGVILEDDGSIICFSWYRDLASAIAGL